MGLPYVTFIVEPHLNRLAVVLRAAMPHPVVILLKLRNVCVTAIGDAALRLTFCEAFDPLAGVAKSFALVAVATAGLWFCVVVVVDGAAGLRDGCCWATAGPATRSVAMASVKHFIDISEYEWRG